MRLLEQGRLLGLIRCMHKYDSCLKTGTCTYRVVPRLQLELMQVNRTLLSEKGGGRFIGKGRLLGLIRYMRKL